MSNGHSPEAFPERLLRAERFLIYFANGDRAYQNHKENMAYAATAALITVFGTALLSESWPPLWIQQCPFLRFALPIVALCVVWVFFLSYVQFQLKNRRWAAIRLAATEDVLTRWSCYTPNPEDIEPVVLEAQGCEDSVLRSVFWPSQSMPINLEIIPRQFPKAFANAIRVKAKEGSRAIVHERILLLFTWLMFGTLFMRTIVVLYGLVYSG